MTPQKTALKYLTTDQLQQESRKFYGDLPDDLRKSLIDYLGLLMTWNKKLNLVGCKDWPSTFNQLIVDSLYLADFLSTLSLPADPYILDVGAGAGIPGIPLRMKWTKGTYLMLEPREKKATFIHYALAKLGLIKTFVLKNKLQDLSTDKDNFDLILSRGLMNWKKFLPLAAPFLTSQGQVLIFSNHAWENQLTYPKEWPIINQFKYQIGPNQVRYFWLLSPNKLPS